MSKIDICRWCRRRKDDHHRDHAGELWCYPVAHPLGPDDKYAPVTPDAVVAGMIRDGLEVRRV